MNLIIDNYDSFSYNVYQLAGSIDPDIRVVRNDELTVDEVRDIAPSRIIISPGPGRPADAGISEAVVKELAGKIPILGICLGHQAICESFGASITYAKVLMHGKSSRITLRKSRIFDGLPECIDAGRYHSLAVDADSLPDGLEVTAIADDGEVMAVQCKDSEVYGLQFHPESILTPDGETILRNFLSI
ncbi:MAG: aminodeoxychorismate/anthranilate synthase component II [Veillonellaceae bacterium]|nr:aminodeoxychorismate/anthranilate synthase component II [Veillonellaceae bacterium]